VDTGPRRLVFLDRDGVINRRLPNGAFVTTWAEFDFLPGAVQAIRLLNGQKIPLIVVTNQRGISLGLYSESDLQQLHERMRQELAKLGATVDGIYYCPHSYDECNCRKPKTGMFEQALMRFQGIDPGDVLVVGDSRSDMKAAQRMNFGKVLVGPDRKSIVRDLAQEGIMVDFSADSLLAAVQEYILPEFLCERTCN